MIIDVFPKAGGTPVSIKTAPYMLIDSFSVPDSQKGTSHRSLELKTVYRQQMAAGTNSTLYLIGKSYYSDQRHLAKITCDPLTGMTMEWVIHNWTGDYFQRVIADTSNCAYVVHKSNTMEKYSPDGELLWSTTENGVLCIGANGNLFVWAPTYIREYDTDGNILNTWEYTCDGTPITFYVNADNEFFIVTSSQLARVTSTLETVWTRPETFSTTTYSDTLCAVDIDDSGNFYMYNDSGSSGIKCINADGELLWDSGVLHYSDMYMTIWVDNAGAVYLANYSSWNVYKVDAKTGVLLNSYRPYEYSGHRAGCASKSGNNYIWLEYQICAYLPYVGAVNWTEDDKAQKKFIIKELEHGSNYSILLSDEEMMLV